MPDENPHPNEVRECDENPEQSSSLKDFDFVFAIRNEREHYELCEPGSAAADEDSRFMRDRGIFEQPELVPIARHAVHRSDAKRGKHRHSES